MPITEQLKSNEVHNELHALREENTFLKRQNVACKLRLSEYNKRIQTLEMELADMKFMELIK